MPRVLRDGDIFFLITARCDGKKIGEACDCKMRADCLSPETCHAAKIVSAEVREGAA